VATDITPPRVGLIVIDLSELAASLVDLVPGPMHRLRREEPGLDSVEKVVEALGEGRRYYEDRRESDVSLMVTALRASGRRERESSRATSEKTSAYSAQAARKAAKTRRKSASEAKVEAEGEANADGKANTGGKAEGKEGESEDEGEGEGS
jgi:hypothetical protein